jgi:hypothetical protein
MYAVVRIAHDGHTAVSTKDLATAAAAQPLWFAAVIVAVLATAAEFQHRTIESTLLQVPQRRRLVAAKTLTAAAYGAILTLVGTASAFGVGLFTMWITAMPIEPVKPAHHDRRDCHHPRALGGPGRRARHANPQHRHRARGTAAVEVRARRDHPIRDHAPRPSAMVAQRRRRRAPVRSLRATPAPRRRAHVRWLRGTPDAGRSMDVHLMGRLIKTLRTSASGKGVRDEIRPGLVDVALNAYGWTGPWKPAAGLRQPRADEFRDR